MKALNYDAYCVARALRRKPSAIRALQPLLSIPGMISLGGGMPNPGTFPFNSISVEMKDGTTTKFTGSDLQSCLQYSATPGLPELVSQLTTIQNLEHCPVLREVPTSITVTTGSQDALAKAFDMFCDEGTSILVDDATYSGSLAFLEPTGCNMVAVRNDEHGMRPESLATILDSWDESKGPKPKVLYTIPTGSNPTGASIPLDRRHEIYDIARRHNLLILEDDPYYYLQYGDRIPSFFGMDTDSRVLRFDSFSKVLSSGLRIGFATGPAPLIDRLNLNSQCTTLHTCGVSQMAVVALFREWGIREDGPAPLDSFLGHVDSVVDFYRSQRDEFVKCLDKHCGGLVEYTVPSAGMFVWMKLVGVEDSTSLILEKGQAKKVLLVPGSSFTPYSPPSPFVRASFSTASHVDMDEACRRLGELLREAK